MTSLWNGISNHQPQDCLFNCLFRCRWKKTSKLQVTGLCEGNSPMIGESPHKGPLTQKMFPFDMSSWNGYSGLDGLQWGCWHRASRWPCVGSNLIVMAQGQWEMILLVEGYQIKEKYWHPLQSFMSEILINELLYAGQLTHANKKRLLLYTCHFALSLCNPPGRDKSLNSIAVWYFIPFSDLIIISFHHLLSKGINTVLRIYIQSHILSSVSNHNFNHNDNHAPNVKLHLLRAH